jgi:hypothetical protein
METKKAPVAKAKAFITGASSVIGHKRYIMINHSLSQTIQSIFKIKGIPIQIDSQDIFILTPLVVY